MRLRLPRAGALVGLLAVVTAGRLDCSRLPPPVVDPAPGVTDRAPVVFVPGVTGVELRDGATGQVVWGRGSNLIRPHDRGYAIARPIVGQTGDPGLEAGGVILSLRLFGVIRKRIYQPIVDLLEANGYRLGDLDHPRRDDSLFLFSYDWRQDNIESAWLLARKLDHLRQVRGHELLRVVLICQSNGAHVCRYLTKYGASTLEEAESGSPKRVAGLVVDKLVLVGSSNGGSLRVLREMNRGRRYVPLIGRRWAPETIFTFVSLFQDLPVYSKDLFLDERGRAIDIELFDPESWRRYGWSVYAERVRERLDRTPPSGIFGDQASRDAYLAWALDRAQRFHRLLHRDVRGFGPTRYYLLTNTHNETPSRSVVVRDEGGWTTLFAGDRELRSRPQLRAAVTARGDGHATLESQMWLSSQESDQIIWDPIDVRGEHFEMILSPVAQRHLLEILDDGYRARSDHPGFSTSVP